MGQQGSQTPVGGLSYAPDSNYVIYSQLYRGRNGVAVWTHKDSINWVPSVDQNETLISSLTIGVGLEEIKIVGNYGYIVNRLANAFYIIDLSDPENPALIGQFDDDNVDTLRAPRSLDVIGNYAYVQNYPTNGVTKINIQDKTNPIPEIINGANGGYALRVTCCAGFTADFNGNRFVSWDLETLTPLDSVSTPGSPMHISIIGDVAYVSGNSTNIYSIDISDPKNMVVLDTFSDPAKTNNSGSYVNDKYLYTVGEYSDNLSIFDISDPYNNTLLSSTTIAELNVPVYIMVSDSIAYINNFTGAAISKIDVSNPSNPVLLSNISTGSGSYAMDFFNRYVANVNYSSGTLQIFNGPYFASKNIIAGNLVSTNIKTEQITTTKDIRTNGLFSGPGGLRTTGCLYGLVEDPTTSSNNPLNTALSNIAALVAGGTNLYTTNGALTGNRTVTGSSFNLDFTSMGNFTATGSGSATYRFNLYPSSSLPVLIEQTSAGDTAYLSLQASLGRATLRATEDIYLQATTALYAEPLEGSSTQIVSARPTGEMVRREEAFFNAYFITDTFTVSASETEINSTFVDAISPSFTISGDSIIYTGTDTAYFDLGYYTEAEILETATGTYLLEISCYKNGLKVFPSESWHKVYFTAAETEPVQSVSKRFYTQLVNGDVLNIRQNGTASISAALHNFSFTGQKIQ